MVGENPNELTDVYRSFIELKRENNSFSYDCNKWSYS